MKTRHILCLVAGLLVGGFSHDLRAAETAPKLSPELRAKVEELRGLPPEERRVKMREIAQNLTPEQRLELQAQLRERAAARENPTERPATNRPQTNRPAPTPAQLEARATLLNERLAALEKAQTERSLNTQETRQLERLRQAKTRMEATRKAAPVQESKTEENAKP